MGGRLVVAVGGMGWHPWDNQAAVIIMVIGKNFSNSGGHAQRHSCLAPSCDHGGCSCGVTHISSGTYALALALYIVLCLSSYTVSNKTDHMFGSFGLYI